MLIRVRTLSRAAAATVIVLGAVAATATPAAAVPTIRERQWYLDLVRVPAAQKISTGKGVTVAVIDTGIDATHRDLSGQVLPGAVFAGDGQGKGDGRTDTDGHGTEMAGLIAGKGGGQNNVLGVAPGAKLLPVVNHSEATDSRHLALAHAIRWAADHGASVLNISQTVKFARAASPEVTDAIRYAMAKDAVVIVGAGNTSSGATWVTPPATVPGVIAVGGVRRSGVFWTGAAHGREIVLTAPAEHIVSTTIASRSASRYELASGTSMATALVTGVVALIRAKYPDLDAANVVNRLIRTAQDKGIKGRDERYGFGLVDAAAALAPGVPAVSAYPLATTAPAAASTHSTTVRAKLLSFAPVVIGVVVFGGVLLVIVVIVVVSVVVSRRRRTRAAPSATRA